MATISKGRVPFQVTEEVFLKEVSKHVLTILKDDGVYRHLRLAQPGTNNMSFDIITWPGFLCYCGDMGSYVFSRVPDMLTFFRGRKNEGALDVNLSYWAEKVEARDRDGLKEYSADRFRENVLSYLEDSEDTTDALRDAVEEEVLYHADEEHEAYRAVHNFNEENFQFIDFFERDCTVYTHRFVWCCYALPWAIRLYDQREVSKAA